MLTLQIPQLLLHPLYLALQGDHEVIAAPVGPDGLSVRFHGSPGTADAP
jgi:hypothetical protein